MVSCSQAEINLYNALKQLSVAFAPLPVFIRGGREYKRIEPDFIIVRNGVMLHVEVDGDTVHKETPADAHERASLLTSEGVIIERVRASECRPSFRDLKAFTDYVCEFWPILQTSFSALYCQRFWKQPSMRLSNTPQSVVFLTV